MRSLLVALVAGLAIAQPSFAQSPYAGLQARPVKALSEQQIADLKAGRGMGLALPAELNGYPGPSHLLELADQIGLTDAQRQAVRGLFDAMKAETIPTGEQLIVQETELDALFAGRKATAESVAALTAEIGGTQARLRAAHLRYHLSTLELLQPTQVERYAELRGYRDGGAGGQHLHHGR
jgi:Spy/CpxP family protein refolding chaperone